MMMVMLVAMPMSMPRVAMTSLRDAVHPHDHTEYRPHPSANHVIHPCSRVRFRDILIPADIPRRCRAMFAT